MADIRIFYGSNLGNSEGVAKMIGAALGDRVSAVADIASAGPEDLASAEALILGTSTWLDGGLQEDWEDFFPRMDEIDLSGKKVGLFGLGDAASYPEEFVDALGTLYEKVKERGAQVVGFWPVEGYDFDESTAVLGDHFAGLVIDEDNQPELTEERVAKWVEMISPEL